MGNSSGKLTVRFTGAGEGLRQPDISVLLAEPLDEGLGHSFCYVRPEPTQLSASKVYSEDSTTFRAISGASVSANTWTPLSTAVVDLYSYNSVDRAATFESSNSFACIPLQPIPRNFISSGPISGTWSAIPGSGPLERGFLSGPIERGFMSGPIDRGIVSGPIEKGCSNEFQRSLSHVGLASRRKSKKQRLIQILRRAISKTIGRGQKSTVAPVRGVKGSEWGVGPENKNENSEANAGNLCSYGSSEDDFSMESQNLQWAQGKAGEDRVHIVVSEEHGWLFVGIYDGFNGPDAPDFLATNLYSEVQKELKGLLWDEKFETTVESENSSLGTEDSPPVTSEGDFVWNPADACSQCSEQENYPCVIGDRNRDSTAKSGRKNAKRKYRDAAKKWEDYQRRWKSEWDRERLELDRKLKHQLNQGVSAGLPPINQTDVLKAMSRALRKTEEAYLDIADKMLVENPELALMGSCVLVMLMKGEDVYVMNVGDSRAVLAQKTEPDYGLGKVPHDLERISEETMHDLESSHCDRNFSITNLAALQLSMDHSTSVEEEIRRIKDEHPNDAGAVMKDRVKGSINVTRAFGAGFLKQPKWNNALLEMFRIDYVGTSPYITCFPSLCHHRLGPKDKFLILSSDGLYQYFTNEEAVTEVELFITLQPEGDPAQHLLEEILFRAAKKAGLDFHELLEVPQGDRRKYHDDISIIVISLEGKIWRSSV